MRRTSAVSFSLVLALVMFGTGPTATVASAQQDCALGERIASDGFTSTSIIDPTSNRWEDEWEMEPEFSDQIGATDVRLNRLTSTNSSGHIYERLLVDPGQSTFLRVNLTTGYRYVLRDLAWVQHHLGATGRCIPTNGCLPDVGCRALEL